MSKPLDETNPPEPGKVARFLDRFDPLTWETPEHITPSMRVGAGVLLVVIVLLMFYVPAKIIGWV
jgi:hypothetical protein